jgi:hypothetical protein
MSAVNRELIEVYRDIGRIIYEQQQNGEWGDSVVRNLAKDLQKDSMNMLWISDALRSYLASSVAPQRVAYPKLALVSMLLD